MVRTRDLFKRTGDTKRTFHTKMGIIKDKKKKKKQKILRGGRNTQKN